ncbi:MAG: hypothetical protein NC343_05225 [Muribaculum sp.]|nr:hypothetical protein [Muribaculaceae bacterium]MCM1081132.1 hypothetical protein [Muribaculum sp.]
MKNKLINTSLFIIAIFLSVSCSTDNDSSALSQTKVSVAISCNASRSKATDAAALPGNELINDWWMAFVDKNTRQVKGVFHRPAENNGAVERETYAVDFTFGKFLVYAFANITEAELQQNAGISFIPGQKLTADVASAVWNADATAEATANIPMSGFLEVEIKSGRVNEFDVEVVRLWSKMQIEIENATGEQIKVGNISLMPAKNNGAVKLLPDYASLEHAPVLPAGATFSELLRPINQNIAYQSTYYDTFYMLESSATSHPTEHYVVKAEVERASERKETITAQTSELQWINRNDQIVLPLKIVGFSLAFKILFYPPIGGYPAVLVEEKSDEYYAKFGSSGKFVLNTKVTDSSDYILAPDEYTIATPLTINDPSGIFSIKPTVDPTTYEIVGELAQGDKTGTATVKFDVTATYKGDETPISYTFSRTLYIIRQCTDIN